MISNDGGKYWLLMGYTATAIMAIFLVIIKDKKKIYKILVAICISIIVFPFFGRVFNGMSYMSNRWPWVLALLCMYILADAWDELFLVSKREWNYLLIFCVLLFCICLIFDKSRCEATFSAIPLFFITLLIIFFI